VTLFQILEQECSDCTLRVLNTRENEEGLLFLKKGVLFDAVCGAAVAQEAAKTVFSWENVDVELYNFCPLKDNKVAADMTSLILKCANKQHASEQPSPVVEKDNPPVSGAKPVGGLAGLLLKKANKRPPS
jgi:hypothetical protein